MVVRAGRSGEETGQERNGVLAEKASIGRGAHPAEQAVVELAAVLGILAVDVGEQQIAVQCRAAARYALVRGGAVVAGEQQLHGEALAVACHDRRLAELHHRVQHLDLAGRHRELAIVVVRQKHSRAIGVAGMWLTAGAILAWLVAAHGVNRRRSRADAGGGARLRGLQAAPPPPARGRAGRGRRAGKLPSVDIDAARLRRVASRARALRAAARLGVCRRSLRRRTVGRDVRLCFFRRSSSGTVGHLVELHPQARQLRALPLDQGIQPLDKGFQPLEPGVVEYVGLRRDGRGTIDLACDGRRADGRSEERRQQGQGAEGHWQGLLAFTAWLVSQTGRCT